MTEQHGYELAPTTEPAGVALGPVLHDGPLKLGAGKQLQHLAENARYSCHGGAGPPYGSRLATQTVAEFYRRRSKANLDKSDFVAEENMFAVVGPVEFGFQALIVGDSMGFHCVGAPGIRGQECPRYICQIDRVDF